MSRNGSMRVSIVGLERLQAKMKGYSDRVPQAVATAVNEIAKEVLTESQTRVPVDTGNLKGSARIAAATPERPSATISYGGTAAGYALIVHETHRTKSKYLEAPAREATPRFREEVGAAIKKSI